MASADLISGNIAANANGEMSRRTWLRRAAAAATCSATGVGLYTWRVEPHWVEVVRRDMSISDLPTSLEGKSLVQISDVHIGDRVDDSFLIHWFQQVSEMNPDIVVFTGDFLTLRHDRSLPTEKMKRVLSHFPRGRLATLGILGNHDYGFRWSDIAAAETVVKIATDAGLDMLRNISQVVSGLQIVGFDDFYSPHFAGKRVLEKVDLKRPTLVLCHNPDVVDLPVWWGYRGWILSGHTHGGQCRAPFFAPPLLPIHNTRYSAGEIPLVDGRRLYVNRALGHSMRVRFNVRPEITVFRLTREKPEVELA
jgi:predicted MPP superfamily phosphohydrolase